MESRWDLHLPTLQSKATDSWQLWDFSTSAQFSQPGQSSREDLNGKEARERWQCLNANLNHASPLPFPPAGESVRLCSFEECQRLGKMLQI